MSNRYSSLEFIYINGRKIKTSSHLSVISRQFNSNNILTLLSGDRYWIDGVGQEDFFNQDYNIAIYEDGIWRFEETQVGSLAYVEEDEEYYYYDGSTLQSFGNLESIESNLGNPPIDNYVLSSDQYGNREWIPQVSYLHYSLPKANGQYLSMNGLSFTNINNNFRFMENSIIGEIVVNISAGSDRLFSIYQNDQEVFTGLIQNFKFRQETNLLFQESDLLNIFISHINNDSVYSPQCYFKVFRR
jgi:hypothetical protein